MNRPAFSPILRSLAAALLLAAFAAQPGFAADLSLQLPGDPAAATLVPVEQALLDLTNADRVANGLDPLSFDADTLAIARARAASQLGTAPLNHYDADGQLAFVNLLQSADVEYQLAGENLARATNTEAGVTARIEQALMNSPLHRKNILEKTFTRVAIGAATDGQGQLTFAEVYRN